MIMALFPHLPGLNAAIAAAGQGGVVTLGAGAYMLGAMVTALAGRVKIQGGNANFGTVLLAGAAGMTMMKVSSSTVVEDITFDGARLGSMRQVSEEPDRSRMKRLLLHSA
jgi:hypothetical protein